MCPSQRANVTAAAAAKEKIEIEKEEEGEANYLRTELRSLGIDCKRRSEFNDNDELETLTTGIKEVYFQDIFHQP